MNVPLGPRSVLAIDDDEIAIDIVVDMLEQLGVDTVHSAGDGRSALRTLGQLPCHPDCVILDVFMPDMDGIEFLAALAKLQFKGPVVLVSAADPHMLQLARQIGFENGLKIAACLTKPFFKADLAQALGLPHQAR